LTRTVFVDGAVASATQDGSVNKPYKRIQTAVDVVNASVAEIVADFTIGGVVHVPPTVGEFPTGEGEPIPPPTVRPIHGGVRHFPIPPTIADSVQDWTILIAPGDYDEDLAISGPVRLALIGLGAFRLGRYTSQGLTASGWQANIVAEAAAEPRSLVWTYDVAQSIRFGAAPQLVIGTIGGTDVIRHGKPIANRISGSILVKGSGWTGDNDPEGGTAFLAIAQTQVDAGITKSQGAPTQPAIDTTGFSGILVDRHFNCRFRGRILGPLNGVPDTPPAYILITSFMSQYEMPVQVSRYGSIQQAAFGAGMTVSQAPRLFRLGVPPGIVNSTFAGTFEFKADPPLPPGPGNASLLLDCITDRWFAQNNATIANATKDLLCGIQQNIQNGDYICVLSDAGKHIYKASGGSGQTVTIPANTSVAYPVGAVLTFINQGGGDWSIAITTDTMTLAGTTSTGTRTLANNGVATAVKVASTSWVISGSGLS